MQMDQKPQHQNGCFFFHPKHDLFNLSSWNGRVSDLNKFCQISLIDAEYGKIINFFVKNFSFSLEVKMCFFVHSEFEDEFELRFDKRPPNLRHELYMSITLMRFFAFYPYLVFLLSAVDCSIIHQKRLNLFVKIFGNAFIFRLDKSVSRPQGYVILLSKLSEKFNLFWCIIEPVPFTLQREGKLDMDKKPKATSK